jgi:hypothetical protein
MPRVHIVFFACLAVLILGAWGDDEDTLASTEVDTTPTEAETAQQQHGRDIAVRRL